MAGAFFMSLMVSAWRVLRYIKVYERARHPYT